MAFTGPLEAEIRTTGNDENGGGFVTTASGQDRTAQDAPHRTLTTASTLQSGTVVDVAVGDFSVDSDLVGNLVQQRGGTANNGWYEIVGANPGANTITLDRSAGAGGSTFPGRIGGAMATPGVISEFPLSQRFGGNPAGLIFWCKAGTYTLSTIAATRGGRVVPDIEQYLEIEGFNATRGDLRTNPALARPVLSAGSLAPTSLVALNGSFSIKQQAIRQFVLDGNNQGVIGWQGLGTSNYSTNHIIDCEVRNCSTGVTGSGMIWGVDSHDNSGDGILSAVGRVAHCTTHHNGGAGFYSSSNGQNGACVHVLSYRNGSVGFGLGGSGWGWGFLNCTAANNTSHGWEMAHDMSFFLGSIATHNGGWGWTNAERGTTFRHCYAFNNTSGAVQFTNVGEQPGALTADPWVDQANDDYTPNEVAGGGAAIRDCYPTVPGYSSQQAAGAVQPVAAGGGLGVRLPMRTKIGVSG